MHRLLQAFGLRTTMIGTRYSSAFSKFESYQAALSSLWVQV
jgi:hypothetical protein